MLFLSLVFGAFVGLSLGLTGGGGAIFAVPLLVYGLAIEPRQAVGVSLAAVGATSAVGLAARCMSGQVEIVTGLMFALSGMMGAPIGAWLSGMISQHLLLILFALLMIVVAGRIWISAESPRVDAVSLRDDVNGPTCRRDPEGKLRLTSPCAILLTALGLLTGVLSGLFGIGGGFVIVPGLVLFSGMGMQRAIGTSLLVITLVSVAGVAAHLLAGRDIPLEATGYFVVGGVLGMFAGTWAGWYLSGPLLQKVFAAAIIAVAIFVVVRSTWYQ